MDAEIKLLTAAALIWQSCPEPLAGDCVTGYAEVGLSQ